MEPTLRSFIDDQGNTVRLTDERLRHILHRHPEMAYHLSRIAETLAYPSAKQTSKSSPSVDLYYRLFPYRQGRNMYLCVVVKREMESDFILTGYLTRSIGGE